MRLVPELFNYSGRISRIELVIGCLRLLGWGIAIAVAGSWIGRAITGGSGPDAQTLQIGLRGVVIAFMVAGCISLAVRRIRDIGLHPLWLLVWPAAFGAELGVHVLLNALHYSHDVQHTVSIVWRIADNASSLFLLLWPSAGPSSDKGIEEPDGPRALSNEPSWPPSSHQAFGRKAVGR